MKKLHPFFLIILLTAALSCKKSQNATTLEITVVDGVTGMPAAGATVNLYGHAADVTGGSPVFSLTTDQTGKVKLPVDHPNQFFIIAFKAAERNYYNGLIPVGIFKTQADIQDSPAQTPSAIIGGVKFKDTNGDGAITSADDTTPPSNYITAYINNTFSATIY